MHVVRPLLLLMVRPVLLRMMQQQLPPLRQVTHLIGSPDACG